MAGMSKMTIIGNLGADPEVRYSQSGTAMCNLRIAVTERRKEGDNYVDHTEWFTLVCFGKTAENAQRFLKKGRQVYGDGRFQARKWTDREGQSRTSLEVVCDKLMFLGSPRDEAGASNSNFQAPAAAASFEPGDGYMNEDVPF
ncbi:MAG: single-stranded DNA-binding protein [Deltaproteobacteria bacterium]|nr:single-stranded DNA-binding protein [Deltaproteobacteria bacterium]